MGWTVLLVIAHPRDDRIFAGSLASNHSTQACDNQECPVHVSQAAMGATHPHLRTPVLQTLTFLQNISLLLIHPQILGSHIKLGHFSLPLPLECHWEKLSLPRDFPKVLCVGRLAEGTWGDKCSDRDSGWDRDLLCCCCCLSSRLGLVPVSFPL